MYVLTKTVLVNFFFHDEDGEQYSIILYIHLKIIVRVNFWSHCIYASSQLRYKKTVSNYYCKCILLLLHAEYYANVT
mgnify:CR=1 FL=1